MSARIALDPGRGISHGIEAIKRIPLQLWLGGAILSFTDSGGGGCSGNPANLVDLFDGEGGGAWDTGGGFDFDFSEGLHQAGFLKDDPLALFAGLGVGLLLGLLCCALVAGLVFFALRCYLLPGWYRLHEECLRTGGGEFSTLFSGQDRFLNMVLWNLLKGVILFAMFLVALVPAGMLGVGAVVLESGGLGIGAALVGAVSVIAATLYVQPGLAFGGEAITFDGLGVMEALSRSWELARGGADLAATEAYLILTRGIEVTENWALLSPDGPPVSAPPVAHLSDMPTEE